MAQKTKRELAQAQAINACDMVEELDTELEQLVYTVDDLVRDAEDQQCDQDLVSDFERLADEILTLRDKVNSIAECCNMIYDTLAENEE